MGHEVRRFPVEQVRTGGKGSVRRKGKKGKGKSNNNVLANSGNKKNPTKTLAEKVGLYPVGDVSEVNMFLEDGSVLHFERPEVSSSFPSYTMTIQGSPQKKALKQLLPNILPQMGVKYLETMLQHRNQS